MVINLTKGDVYMQKNAIVLAIVQVAWARLEEIG